MYASFVLVDIWCSAEVVETLSALCVCTLCAIMIPSPRGLCIQNVLWHCEQFSLFL